MASDSTSSDDECSSNSKSDNKFSGSIKRKRGRTDKPVRRQKQKRTKLQYDQDKSGSAESPKPRSRLNITYFSNLIEGLSNEQRSIIENSSFGSLLNFQRCAIPLSFVKWIASHTDVSCSDIVVNGRSIPINPNTTNFILGIQNGGLEIKHDNDAGKHFFHQHYGSTKPLISFFGTKLLSDKGVNKLPEDDVLRCFMVVALSTFLCPNSDTHPSPKYLEPLIDVKSSSKWNWSKFVYEWLMTYIAKFSKESKSMEQTSKTIGSCEHLLAIKATEKLSYDAICSGARCIEQQGNNSNMSRSNALQQYHSKSFNPSLLMTFPQFASGSQENILTQHTEKNAQLAAKPLKATQPTSTQPDKEESNKDDLFMEPIYTIPAKKEEVQPTKDLESNSTEFVIDIEGPYDVKYITGHTTDKTKFILVNYSNSSEDHKSQDPTQDESDNIPNKSTNQPQINNEQSSPQTPLHINITSARTPATKQVIQIVYFLKNWEGAGKEEDYENCARQTFTFARNKKPLHYYDLLIFPCLYDNHWFVFTVDIKGHHFIFLDSIYDENSKYHKKIQGLLIPGLIAMWEEFSDVEKDFSKFDIQYPPITRQNNG
uniref:Ubiquitin-like protease family profile domain-containing protein n=1 Tax=Oryza nivara TaxID=4536 RepID=A0A0E0HAN1_ORYNI